MRGKNMEEYLTVKELCDRIKYKEQTIYNLISRGTFVLGRHFLKPTPKKILFKWSEIKAWIGDAALSGEVGAALDGPEIKDKTATQPGQVSLIRI